MTNRFVVRSERPIRSAGCRDAASDGAAHPADGDSLASLLRRRLASTPNLVAVSDGRSRLTYAELDRRTAELGVALQTKGVGPDVLVGIHLERSVDLTVAVVAVLRAGGAWLPLDTEGPDTRLTDILDDARPCVVLCDDEDRLERAGAGRLAMRMDAESPTGAATHIAASRSALDRATGSDLAYVIYTSGSTGRPKGVMIEHAAIVNRLQWMQDRFVIGPGDVVAQKTPVTFDVSVWELLWPLLYGAKLAYAAPGGHRDPVYLTGFLEVEGVTVTHFVPSMLREWLRQLKPGRCPGLKRVMASGEALSSDLVSRFYEHLPTAELHNLYGPTEAAVDVTHWACVPVPLDGAGVPIGHPISGIELFAVDAEGQEVPDGTVGELCISGVGVARGYLNRPELDRERFAELPGRPGSRAYRTGDLASRRPDGAWLYHGRNDRQVKIGGVRLELGEVEAALASLPYVEDKLVLARVRQHAMRLEAVAVLVGEVDEHRWRADLATLLPAVAVPSILVAVERIPVTPHGKADTFAVSRLLDAAQGNVPQRNASDDLVEQLWVRAVGTAEPDFFAAGGGSLTAVRLLGDVAETYGVQVAVADFLSSATLQNLRLLVAEAPPAVPLAPTSRAGTLRLNRFQERLWFLQELEPHSTAMSAPTAIRIEGVDREIADDAVRTVLARHEVFRSRIWVDEGEPRVLVGDEPPEIAWVDLPGLGKCERTVAIRTAIEDEASRPFDVSQDELLRTRGVSLADDDHVVVMVTHQIIADGWSWSLVCREVHEAIAGLDGDAGGAALQIVDHAAWQREHELTAAHRTASDEAVAHWRRTLAGAPRELPLPTDAPRGPGLSMAGDWVPVPFSDDLPALLRSVTAERQVTELMVMLAGYTAWLGRLAGQESVVVGTPMANRVPAWTTTMIGYFVTTVPQRIDVDPDATFADLLIAARDAVIDGQRHSVLPVEAIVAQVAGQRRADRLPIFQNLLVFQNMPEWEASGPTASVSIHQYPPRHTHYDVKLEVFPRTDGYAARLVFSADRFARPRAEAMAQQLARFLEGCLRAPDSFVDDILL